MSQILRWFLTKGVVARRAPGVGTPSRTAGTLVVVAMLVAAPPLPSPALGFDKNSKAQEKRDDAKVRDARKDLDKAQDKLRDEQRELAQALKDEQAAEAREKAALRAIEAARDKAEARLGKAVGLDKALAEQKEAQAVFDKAKAPALEALHATTEFQTAKKAADAAIDRLREIRAQQGLSDEDRKAKSAELNRQALAPGKLETAALDADTAAAAARDRLKKANEAVAGLREKIRGEVDSDAAVKQARAESDEAKREARRRNDATAKQRRAVADAQGKLNNEQGQLQKAIAQDRKNDDKKNDGKPKKR